MIKENKFKLMFYVNLISVILSGGLGIYLAVNGYSFWALIYQQISFNVISTVLFLFVLKWFPTLNLSIKRVQVLLTFGWKILLSSLLSVLFEDIRSLIIGKRFNSTSLGFYNRGQMFPSFLVRNINGSIQSVLFPILSNNQEDHRKVKNMMRKSIQVGSLIIFPMMIGLYIISEPLVIILLTDKWIFIVPYIRIFSLSYALWPIHTTNLQAINAIGRSDVFLKLEFLKKIIETIILVPAIFLGLHSIAYSVLIISVISSYVNSFPNKKLLNYGYFEQLKDILPQLLASIVMGIVAFLPSLLIQNIYMLILTQLVVGIIVFYFMEILKINFLRKNKKNTKGDI
jgi:O-antigen/teichoic acid export membrane protein